MNKFVISIILGSAAIIGLGLFFALRTPSTPPSPQTAQITLNDQDQILAPASLQQDQPATPSAVIVEYSDFQCPACASQFTPLKQFLNQNTDSVVFVYRHFPLRQIHPNAQLAAQAAESAGLQEKFFAFHDLLFQNQDEWSDLKDPQPKFTEYAQSLDLDTDKFLTDIKSAAVVSKVSSDYQSGLSAGVNSTPTLFFNGLKLSGVQTLGNLNSLLSQ